MAGLTASDMISNLAKSKGGVDKKTMDVVDIITFCRAEWGLGLGRGSVPDLYPTQRVILKCYYGLPLEDGDNRDIIIKDKFNDKVLFTFNEKEFASYLYDDGRLNTNEFTGRRLDLHLVAGRRGSKTTITSFIVCYELYKLLSVYSPQEYFGIMPEDVIEMTSISTNIETSKNFFDRVSGNLSRSKFFKKFMKNVKNTEVYFQTQRDIDKYGHGGRASIKVRAAPCAAKTLRGQNNVLVVFDEAAFFFKDDASGKSASSDRDDKAIYKAVTPSLTKFINPDGTPAGRVIQISSPADESGMFYEHYEHSLSPKNKKTLMFQIPSWEMDPSIPSEYLVEEYNKSPVTYMSEYGARFSSQLSGWIQNLEILYQNVDPTIQYRRSTINRVPHFLGFDYGSVNDGSSVAIVHPEFEDRNGVEVPVLVVDLAEVRYASKEGLDHFDPVDIAMWVADTIKGFPVVAGLMDHHYQESILPVLKRRGFTGMEAVHATDSWNSEIYQNFMAKLVSRTIRIPAGLPNSSNPRGYDDTELIEELQKLQCVHKSKYQIKVFVPASKGHDDLSDAVARAILCATQYLNNNAGKFLSGRHGKSGKVLAMPGAYSSNLRKLEQKRPSAALMNSMNLRGMRFGR